MSISLIDSGLSLAQHTMEMDENLLKATSTKVILHFYEWESPTITYGHFMKLDSFLNNSLIKQKRIQLAKRPTGGGITFHDSHFTYSICIPSSSVYYKLSPLEHYKLINENVLKVIKKVIPLDLISLYENVESCADSVLDKFCMAKISPYDILLKGIKIGGGAQRRTKHAFLHQGFISLSLPDNDFWRDIFLNNSQLIPNSIQTNSTYLLNSTLELKPSALKEKLKKYFIDVFSELF